jgi:hypothetical protein
VYARKIGDREYTFGVSGLLFRSNVLMYDHQTESLWSQVKRRAVTGPMAGARLEALPSSVTTWGKWQKKHPRTMVLSLDTGHRRDYASDPYESYYQSRRGMFSRFFAPGPGEEEKELVAGLEAGGAVKAYPLSLLRKKGRIEDRVGREQVILSYDDETDRVVVIAGEGREIQPIVVYWFVWKGIHPETLRYGKGAE